MRTSWLMAFSILAFCGMLISVTLEGLYIGTDETHVFWKIMNPDFASYTNPLLAVGGFFIWAFGFVQALWIIFFWDYSFLEGPFEILRMFGWAISLAMVVSLVLALRGTGSG